MRKWKRGVLQMTSAVKHWSRDKIAKYNEKEATQIIDDLPNRNLICTVNRDHPDYEQNANTIRYSPEMIELMKMLAFDENAHIDLIRQTAYNLLSKIRGPFFTLGRNEIQFDSERYLVIQKAMTDQKQLKDTHYDPLVNKNYVLLLLRNSDVVDQLNLMLCNKEFFVSQDITSVHSQMIDFFK